MPIAPIFASPTPPDGGQGGRPMPIPGGYGQPTQIPELTERQILDLLRTGVGHDEYAVSKIMLTPAVCEALLARNSNNRPIRMHQVNGLVSAIKRGEWRITQQGVAMRSDMVLGDGQHRILAAKLAQIPVPVFCWWNMAPEAMDVIDIGRKRTISDVFHLGGVTDAPLVSSAARMLFRYRNNAWSSKQAGTNVQVIAAYNAEPMISDHLAEARRVAKGTGLSTAIAVLGVYLSRTANLEGARPDLDVDLWFEQLAHGENINRGMPAWHLRSVVRGWEQRRLRTSHRNQILVYNKAWCAYVNGDSSAHLRAKDNDVIPDAENPVRKRRA